MAICNLGVSHGNGIMHTVSYKFPDIKHVSRAQTAQPRHFMEIRVSYYGPLMSTAARLAAGSWDDVTFGGQGKDAFNAWTVRAYTFRYTSHGWR